jgi:hypothetical protein
MSGLGVPTGWLPHGLRVASRERKAPARASRAGAVGFEGIQAAAAWRRLRERDLAARVIRS